MAGTVNVETAGLCHGPRGLLTFAPGVAPAEQAPRLSRRAPGVMTRRAHGRIPAGSAGLCPGALFRDDKAEVDLGPSGLFVSDGHPPALSLGYDRPCAPIPVSIFEQTAGRHRVQNQTMSGGRGRSASAREFAPAQDSKADPKRWFREGTDAKATPQRGATDAANMERRAWTRRAWIPARAITGGARPGPGSGLHAPPTPPRHPRSRLWRTSGPRWRTGSNGSRLTGCRRRRDHLRQRCESIRSDPGREHDPE
jgi:hypothetical protein